MSWDLGGLALSSLLGTQVFIMIIKESCLVEIYTKNTDRFSVGMVFCQNKDCVIFKDINPQGKIIGYYVMQKNIISELNYDTEYLTKINKYMEYGETHPYSNWFSLKPVALNPEESLILQVLEYARDNNTIITVELTGKQELETCYVTDISHDKITLSCLDISNAKLLEEITVPIQDAVFI